MVARPCLGCGRPIPSGSRCASCRRGQQRIRAAQEPWRALYSTRAWHRARRRALARDGWRCRVAEDGLRCPIADATGRSLHVHHTETVEALWKAAPSAAAFLAAACDPGILITVCADHHKRIEVATA